VEVVGLREVPSRATDRVIVDEPPVLLFGIRESVRTPTSCGRGGWGIVCHAIRDTNRFAVENRMEGDPFASGRCHGVIPKAHDIDMVVEAA